MNTLRCTFLLALAACGSGGKNPGNLDADGDGVTDDVDACAGFPDGADADGDGIADGCDPCPDSVETDDDGDGACGSDDPCPDDNPDDSDADGICDSDDACPLDADPDSDDDGDGVCDSDDLCPGFNDANDGDGDGMPNQCDACPYDALDDTDGDGRCDTDDRCHGYDDNLDGDGDNQPDDCDPCPTDNPNDTDGDGVCNSVDPCPRDNPDDTDGDGVCDFDDPCPLDNPDDTDGDGRCDSNDRCPGFDDNLDADGDLQPDDCDPCPADNPNDTDGDGVCDSLDPCPLNSPDDTDGDGICDSDDRCPVGDDNLNLDGDQYPDPCDPCPGDGTNACIPPPTHMTVPFYPTDSTGQWCYADALLYYEYQGEMTWDECENLMNLTGTQPYVGQYTMYPAGWIGDQDAGNAVIANSNGWDWMNEEVVPRTQLHSCQLAVFDHRTAPTAVPLEQIYFDPVAGRVWHFWDLNDQTHSQALAFADNLGARIINPNVVGLIGLPRMTAPTHWCHAGAEYNGGSNCNSDQICDFMVGYFD